MGRVASLVVLAGAMIGSAVYMRQTGFPAWSTGEPVRSAPASEWLDDLYSNNPKDVEAASQQVKTLGDSALPVIRETLRNKAADRSRRKAALKACVLLEHTAAPVVPEVAEQLKDPELTEEAALALSFMGSAAFAPLREGFLSNDPAVRRESLRSIGKLKARAPLDGRAVVPLMIAGLMDDVPSVRVVAATYLGIIAEQPDQAVPALVRALEDPDLEVQRGAATALGSFGEAAASAVPALRKAAGSRDPGVAGEAGRALIKLQPNRH